MLSESLIEELRRVEASALTLLAEFRSASVELSDVKDRANSLSRSHSNSLFGDHAFTYYRAFDPPPSGFDVEWGHLPGYSSKHNKDWHIYPLEDLLNFVYGEDSFENVEEHNQQLDTQSLEIRDRALDLFALISDNGAGTLAKLATEVRDNILSNWELASAKRYVRSAFNNAPSMTRDSSNISQGMRAPVHVTALAQIHFLEQTADSLSTLANAARRILIMSELSSPSTKEEKVDSNIFIGHGRSPLWRELQAYIEKDLGLATEEFNSEPVAGLSTL